MRRSGPLTRRAPLPAGQGLTRGTPIRSTRKAPRRAGERLTHGPGAEEARRLVRARSRGVCEVCGARPATDQHHRLVRRYGPDCPCNLLDLCAGCHHQGVHAHPGHARERGWIVPQTWDRDPATVPVLRTPSVRLVRRAEWVLLDCDGSWRPSLETPE